MQLESTKLIYSVFSGTYYDVLEKDVKLLDVGQIPLKKKPPTSCKKCYGRGYLGRDKNTYAYDICNCIRKCIDFDFIKTLEKESINLNSE
jgi:hypothetical protein